MKVLVAFSGGKDSHACLIKAHEMYGKNITAVFCDTGHENKLTYEHVNSVCKSLGVELVIVKSTKYENFQHMAVQKKRYPSTKARFCTEELKMKPMIDYVLQLQTNLIIFEGKRRDESQARSKLDETCLYFKYYFEPYTWKVKDKFKHLYVNVPVVPEQVDLFGIPIRSDIPLNEIPEEHKTPVYFSYRKKDVLKFVSQYAHELYRPVLYWTAQEVINYILINNHHPNPLYFKGFSRVGCFPCVMASHQEVWGIITQFPTEWWELKEKENALNRTFFPPKYIPEWACENKKYPTLEDVEKYLAGQRETGQVFEQPKGESRCMSFYHLCE